MNEHDPNTEVRQLETYNFPGGENVSTDGLTVEELEGMAEHARFILYGRLLRATTREAMIEISDNITFINKEIAKILKGCNN